MARKKLPSFKYRTPTGTLIYPHLNKPDTHWGTPGKYHAKLALSLDDAREFRDKCMEFAKELVGPAKAKKIRMPYKRDEKDETQVLITAKANPDYPPKLVDVTGKPVSRASAPMISNGSRGKLSMSIVYLADIPSGPMLAARLNGVQLIKVQEMGEQWDDASDELGDDEGGFVAAEETEDNAGFGTQVPEDGVDDSGEFVDDDDEEDLVDEDEEDDADF